MENGEFVRLNGARTGFALGTATGRPWFFCGANCYYLMTRAADPGCVADVTAVLDDLAAAGVNVVRTWAFADGESQWNSLQFRPGFLDERVFKALDWVIAEAGRRGLRLLLALTNYWEDFGGMKQYVAWSRATAGLPPEQASADDFYEDQRCQEWYRNFVTRIVTRVNTVTGVAYREDPAILGWAPANEPQCHADCAGAKGTIAAWAHHAAAFIKQLDRNHLVFMDCEGFLGPSTPASCCRNPYDCAANGCDFGQDCGSPHIDVACIHLYPELWLPKAEEDARLGFALAWVDEHVRLCRHLGKPLCLTEFGKKAGPTATSRPAYYSAVLDRALKYMRDGAPLAGTAFWTAAAPSYPDYDGFTVYFSEPERGRGRGAAESDGTAGIIRQHAAHVLALNGDSPAAESTAKVAAAAAPDGNGTPSKGADGVLEECEPRQEPSPASQLCCCTVQ